MTMVVVMVAALHWRHGPVRRYGQSAGRRTAAQTEGDYISGAAALCRREPGGGGCVAGMQWHSCFEG